MGLITTKHRGSRGRGVALTMALFAVLTLAGCASGPSAYRETYEIKNLTVVFLDEENLQQKWSLISGKPAVSLSSANYLNVVRGFFDFNTNTIYCPKMDFTICGHELHHAVLGRFHPDH
jgi:hypothetical protein